jgi:hypothetical protein
MSPHGFTFPNVGISISVFYDLSWCCIAQKAEIHGFVSVILTLVCQVLSTLLCLLAIVYTGWFFYEQEEKRAALLEKEEEELKELAMKHEQDLKDWKNKAVSVCLARRPVYFKIACVAQQDLNVICDSDGDSGRVIDYFPTVAHMRRYNFSF